MISTVNSTGGTTRQITFEGYDADRVIVGYIREEGKPIEILHVNPIELQAAVDAAVKVAKSNK